jgi:cytochrome c-type biogenesis protein CcmH
MKTAALAGVLLMHAVSAAAQAALAGDIDARVRDLSGQLRCLVCQNESVGDSGAPLAADLRREIRARMEAGASDDEILAYLTSRYGDFVRYRPPLKPRTYALWFGPFVLLGAAVAAMRRSVTRRALSAPLAAPSSAERRRVRRMLSTLPPDRSAPTATEANLSVYRSQLHELTCDRRDGLVSDDDFARERDALEWRLILDLREGPPRRASTHEG